MVLGVTDSLANPDTVTPYRLFCGVVTCIVKNRLLGLGI